MRTPEPETVTVRALRIVDERGAERIRLSVEEDGTATIMVRARDDGSFVRIEAAERQAWVGVGDDDGVSAVFDDDGRSYIDARELDSDTARIEALESEVAVLRRLVEILRLTTAS